MNEKMTYVRALSYVLDNCNDLPTDVIEKLEALRTQTEKRHSSDSKPTKKQEENTELANQLYELMLMEGGNHTVSEWIAISSSETVRSLTNQKVSALMRILEREGKVAKTSEKRKSYFEARAVEEEGN